jgi:DnaJ-domain-containing protein 1
VIRWLILLAIAYVVWRVIRNRLLPPPAVQPPPPRADLTWDPHAVLGVERGASDAQLTHAYRERIKEYHPDRVASLGPELRDLAHRKTLEIQRAWSELRPK